MAIVPKEYLKIARRFTPGNSRREASPEGGCYELSFEKLEFVGENANFQKMSSVERERNLRGEQVAKEYFCRRFFEDR